jgi:alkylhydroperoxidase family enzyme
MQESASRTAQPLLTPQPPAGEEARVAATLGAIEQRLGFVPDGLRLFGISPPLLESYVSNIGYFNSGERLSPVLMTMIRYLVSSNAKCSFCIDLNEGFLENMGVDVDQARAARDDLEAAPVAEHEMPLLRLAIKSVTHPDSTTQADLDAARAHGWSDRDIFDVVAQAASNRAFNYVMRTFHVEQQGVFA